ncbi:MAG: pantoate--beta-alanine ligase [bacterium]|nr:pantoate--beta-alanine ligase [bacterium]
MRSIRKLSEMKGYVRSARAEGRSVGLVPTMGYFHEGHLSLMRAARSENDLVVVSLFVNPTQFGPDEDYDRYPRDLNRDVELALAEGVDVLFTPDREEMYPEGEATRISVVGLSEKLCGASRPGHFQGVATVVAKLFNIVRPHRTYFGAKDYQQTVIVRKMAADLHFDLEIVIQPTVREDDGLAMSSRNAYLNEDERKAAICLKESLDQAVQRIDGGERNADRIRGGIRERIGRESLARIDYVSVSESATLTEVSVIQGEVLIALAVFVGATRLIDNVVVRPQAGMVDIS